MIQINELRIGNLIQEGKVEQIDNSIDEVYYSGDGYYLSNYCCNLNPIPLNEEWLLKFGFTKCDNEYWFEKGFFGISHEGCVNLQGRGRNEFVVESIIKYVHQLQNLYFALVNSELQLLEAGI